MWFWLKKCNKTINGLRFWSLISLFGRMGWHQVGTWRCGEFYLSLSWVIIKYFEFNSTLKKDIEISWKVVTLLYIGTCLSDIPFWFDDKTTVGNEFIFLECFVCGKGKYGKNFAIWLAGWMSTHWRVQSCQRFSWRFC